MLGGLGPTEILLIFLALLLLFGAKKIPELARGLGGGIVEFRNALRGDEAKKSMSQPAAGEEKS